MLTCLTNIPSLILQHMLVHIPRQTLQRYPRPGLLNQRLLPPISLRAMHHRIRDLLTIKQHPYKPIAPHALNLVPPPRAAPQFKDNTRCIRWPVAVLIRTQRWEDGSNDCIVRCIYSQFFGISPFFFLEEIWRELGEEGLEGDGRGCAAAWREEGEKVCDLYMYIEREREK